MGKIIIWGVLLLLYSIFKSAGKKAATPKSGPAGTPRDTPPAPSSTTPSTATRPLSDMLGDLLKPAEFRKPAAAQPKTVKKQEPAKKPVVYVKAQSTIIHPDYGIPGLEQYEYENISDTEIKAAEEVVWIPHPLLTKFNLRDAVIAGIILERPEW